MQKAIVLFAVLAAPIESEAQNVNNTFRFDLSVTLRTGAGSAADPLRDLQTGGSIGAVSGAPYRLEIRYRFEDLNPSDNVGCRGLTASVLTITRSGSGTGTPLVHRGRLTTWQFEPTVFGDSPGTAPRDPDGTELVDPSGTDATGMHNVFRTFVGDDDLGNGRPADNSVNPARLTGNPFSLTPLTLGAPGQRSWTGDLNPLGQPANPIAWGMFSFDVVLPPEAGTYTFTAAAPPDAGSGARCAFFTRTGLVDNPIPVTTINGTDGVFTFVVVPTPGAIGVMGLVGLVATRRHRA